MLQVPLLLRLMNSQWHGVYYCYPLLGIPVKSQGQDVKISMMYIKQNNLLILNLTHNTDKEVVIMNQSSLNELSGSRITIIQNVNGKKSETLFPLFDTEGG